MAELPDETLRTNGTHDEEGPPDDLSGRTLGDFELLRRIGVGGMGQVYLARQKSLKRHVAIKILKTDLAKNTSSLRRFQAEAEAVANLSHAHIVQVYAIGEADGLHYMALEYVDGRNLRDYLEKKGLPDLPQAIEIMRQVALALERAGEHGFVHRDIKPENILISRKGEVKIADFGLSRALSGEKALHLTQSGVSMGTPLYMSPEQVRGQAVDPRSDIYSFGVTCYHMLSGEPPFRGQAAFDVALQHVQNEARPLSTLRPDLPSGLVALVHKMMAKRPEERYQSAREVLVDLNRLREGLDPLQASPLMLTSTTTSLPFHTPYSTSATTVTLAIPQVPPPSRAWRYRWLTVAGLSLLAVGAGATAHWATAPSSHSVDPEAALQDIDPSPDVLREKELRRLINDKTIRLEVATDAILELALLQIKDGRSEEALKLFDVDTARRYGAFTVDASVRRDQLTILCGLGKGIVLAYQDKAEESNQEFSKLLREYPAPNLRPDKIDMKAKGAAINRGVLETFFLRPSAGVSWKRAIGEALDRNSRNLGSKLPELDRLRTLPTRARFPRG
jgi:serine/threonine protein kinase